MTKNRSTPINRFLPVAGIIFTILLSFPFISLSKESVSYPGKREAVIRERIEEIKGKPFFSELFVNAEHAGTISHVSSITPLSDGSLACVWYQGSREGAKNVSIYISFFRSGASAWSEPIVLLSREQSSRELGRYVKKLGNPMIFSDSRKRLWLFYASVFAGGWSGASLNFKMSPDGGTTWLPSEKMILSPFFNLTNNVKNKAIELDDGSLLVPVYHEFITKYSQLVHFIPGGDGVRYEIWNMTSEGKAIQPSIIPDGNRRLTAFFRNMGDEKKKHILRSTSSDLGKTWTPLSETPLPNPNSGFDMIGLGNGAYLGVINDSFENRNNLTIVLSEDRGKTWRPVKVIESKKDSEYSYPSIVRDNSGTYHVTYTYERKKIKHIRFNEEWLKQNI